MTVQQKTPSRAMFVFFLNAMIMRCVEIKISPLHFCEVPESKSSKMNKFSIILFSCFYQFYC